MPAVSGEDAAVLRNIDNDLRQSFVAVTVKTFIIAIYTVLVLMTGRLVTGKRRSTVSVCTTTAVFVMFGMALALWMIDIHDVISEMDATLRPGPSATLADAYSAHSAHSHIFAAVEDILYAYLTNIGDAIIIWRAFALWAQTPARLVLVVPLLFFLGSVAMSISITYCATRGADITLGAFSHPPFCRNVQTASYSMTLATTGVATLLIAYKAWEYRRIHFEAFGTLSRQTRAQKILAMLVESGVLYMLFFLVQVVGSLGSINDSIDRHPSIAFGFTVYDYMSSLIVGMYPTIVVLLVHSKHSVLRSDTDGTARGTGASTGIAFKRGGPGDQSASAVISTMQCLGRSSTSEDPEGAPAGNDHEGHWYEMSTTKAGPGEEALASEK
ncbi:hypothetical protein C8Q79DRAFT_1012717 [Trametes meyenii]|nr:hypothetical protein C8Q79DRAFT_1012717 [Trametes meyenii]